MTKNKLIILAAYIFFGILALIGMFELSALLGFVLLVTGIILLFFYLSKPLGLLKKLFEREIYVRPTDLMSVGDITIPEQDFINILQNAKHNGLFNNADWLDVKKLILYNVDGGDMAALVNGLVKAKHADLIEEITQEKLSTPALMGSNLDLLVDAVIKAEKSGINYDFDELIGYNLPSETFMQIINSLISLKNAGILVSQRELLDYYNGGGNINVVKNTILKAQRANLEISFGEMNRIFFAGGDLEKFVDTMIMAHKMGLTIPLSLLLKHNLTGEAIGKIIKSLIIAKEAGVSITLDNLINYELIGGRSRIIVDILIKAMQNSVKIDYFDLERNFITARTKSKTGEHLTDKEKHEEKEKLLARLVDALIEVKREGMDMQQVEIEEYSLAGVDVKSFVTALNMAQKILRLENAKEKLLEHFFNGGNPFNLTLGLIKAKGLEIQLDYGMAGLIDLTGNLQEVLNQTANPYTFPIEMNNESRQVLKEVLKEELPEESTRPLIQKARDGELGYFNIITQDGTVMAMKINVTAQFNIKRYSGGSEIETIFDRAKEAFVSETGNMESYTNVLQNRKALGERVKNKLLGNEEIPANSTKDKFTLQEEINQNNEKQKEHNKNSRWIILDISIQAIEIDTDLTLEIKKKLKLHEIDLLNQESDAENKMAVVEIKKSFAKAIESGSASMKDYQKYRILNKNIKASYNSERTDEKEEE